MIPVWVVDDHSVIRQGIKQILAHESPDFRVVQEAGNGHELLELLKAGSLPKLLILDLSMPGKGGLEVLEDLKTAHPDIPVLILSMHPEDQYALRALKAGASGYLSKECAPEQLVTALNTILKGEKYITSRVAHILTNNLSSPQNTENPHETLSDREFQILLLIAQGNSLTEIGEKFFLSVKTVSTYRTRVLKKMSMKSNAELIQYVIKHNLIVS